ncbi:DUF5105 domain-containing protein [Clostridium neonatale]|uniref:DUF5105 domain-containing protein n=1 Tax=Clostridium neonatale TaxID=137838 RepID=UPI001D206301|nr:DUF5105 domain-containing protein [Clostridium neonatale]CAG9715132.1 conserved exported hypothetical protein [Clostridium neonatale]CAI3591291.1 putative lipoprotein [Clostridium neonatale]CAI3595733.1 putative lipoprotein [Clostridium neonatale]
MKRSKKIITVLVSILMLTTMLIGCGGPKITPEESTNIVLEIIFKGDNSNLDKVGITQEEFNDIRKSMEDSMMSVFDSSGISIKDETKTNLLNSFLEGMKKVEYEVSTTSEDKKQAIVEVKLKGMDMTKISQDLAADVQAYASQNPQLTQEELIEYTFTKEAELIKNAPIKDEAKSINITFTNENNIWTPNETDMQKLGAMVAAF